MKVSYGLFRLIFSLVIFVANWRLFLLFVKHLSDYDSAGTTGRVIGFFLILFYAFFLFFGGLSDLRKTKLIPPKLIWVGIIIGIIISLLMFAYNKTAIHFSVGVTVLVISIIEIIRLQAKKTVPQKSNEVIGS